MIKIAIVDDSQSFLEEIHEIIKKYYESIKMQTSIQCYHKSEYLMYDLDEDKNYNIYFLDIEMPKISGIELAERIRKSDQNAFIVFITSYLKYSIVGYELKVYRYIPKSAIQTKLRGALESMTQELGSVEEEVYIINTSSRYEKIPYQEIVYVYKDGKNSILICINRECKVRKSLKQIMDELNSEKFLFVERGYIVNITQISKVMNQEVFLQNGEVLHIGRSHSQNVKQKIVEYLSDK